MGGMRVTPPGIHREPGGPGRPPLWWIIWLGAPHAPGSVILGRSKRLERHLTHRFFPETGEKSRDITGWVAGVEWLIGVHRGHASD
jgi:hypothetical protein